MKDRNMKNEKQKIKGFRMKIRTIKGRNIKDLELLKIEL